MKADKVYLISQRPGDAAASYFEKVKTWLRSNYIQIQIQEEYTDLWDLVACITKFKQIVTNERGNLAYINVSTGTKVTAIAGTIVSMLTGCTPYYAKVNYGIQQPAVPPTEIVEEPFEIPVYRITRPDARSVKLLEFINQSEGSISKKELIQKLRKAGIIRSVATKQLSASASHSQLRRFLDPLQKDWHFVTVESRGRSSTVRLTDEGRTALRIFG